MSYLWDLKDKLADLIILFWKKFKKTSLLTSDLLLILTKCSFCWQFMTHIYCGPFHTIMLWSTFVRASINSVTDLLLTFNSITPDRISSYSKRAPLTFHKIAHPPVCWYVVVLSNSLATCSWKFWLSWISLWNCYLYSKKEWVFLANMKLLKSINLNCTACFVCFNWEFPIVYQNCYYGYMVSVN